MRYLTAICHYFFPPQPSFEEDFPTVSDGDYRGEDHPTEEVNAPAAVEQRNPLVDQREGDVLMGIYGGVRHFIRFDEVTGEALFTRANRPQVLRESPEKWAQFLKNATVVSTEK